MKIYTKRGDDGSTGLLFGGRVSKASHGPEAYGTTDETVSALGLARCEASGDLGELILRLQRDLFVVGAELATGSANRHKLESGSSKVTTTMIEALEHEIDAIEARVGMPTEFVVPGGNRLSAALDIARTVARRAERAAVTWASDVDDDTLVVAYLNRLADLIYMMAREAEGTWTATRAE